MATYAPLDQLDPVQREPTPTSTTPLAYHKQTNTAGLPRIPLNLRDHKLPIAIQWGAIVLTSSILPIAGFFALRYGTDLAIKTCLSPWLALTGVISVFSLGTRSWALIKKTSTCRPLNMEGGGSRWAMDYFGWNFLFGFVVLTIIIALGISLENVTVVSLPLTILILYVSLELLLVQAMMSLRMRAPIRFSSVSSGSPARPGSYVIAEDVVAVDGKQGQAFRQAWSDRYEASAAFRSLLRRLDLLWGTTGLAIVAVVWGCVFGVDGVDFGYAIGWSLPWVWAGAMTVVTIQMSKNMLRKEARMQRYSQHA